jgi:AcrR family transcriptional regulator
MAQYETGIQTKLNILRVAEELFYENGFLATSVNEINERSNTAKSSFYHHFSNKNQLGNEIYDKFVKNNTRVSKMFESEPDQITAACLDYRTYWKLFYEDEKVRRFLVDISSENVLEVGVDAYIYYLASRESERDFSDLDIRFIRTANTGIIKQLTLDAYQISDNYDEISDYYERFLFQLFYIDKYHVELSILKSKEMMNLCTIDNEGFNVLCALK